MRVKFVEIAIKLIYYQTQRLTENRFSNSEVCSKDKLNTIKYNSLQPFLWLHRRIRSTAATH